MAYMSEEGYNKLLADLKQLETIERPKLWQLSLRHAIKVTCRKMQNMMLQKKLKVFLK